MKYGWNKLFSSVLERGRGILSRVWVWVINRNIGVLKNCVFVFRGYYCIEGKFCIGWWVRKFFSVGIGKISVFVNIYIIKKSCMNEI